MGGEGSPRYIIEAADLEHSREEIISFWRTHFPRWHPTKFEQFYLNNPAGRAMCWLAREQESEPIVAAYAIFPRQLYIKGEPVLAGICGDMAADPRHRGSGVGSLLQRAASDWFHKSNLVLLYGTANPISTKVLSREGFQAIGDSVRVARVTDAKSLFRRKRLLKLLAPVGRLVDSYIFSRSRERAYVSDTEHELKQLVTFDSRFDSLNDQVRANYEIVGDRGSSFLNWRYVEYPQREFHIVALYRAGNDVPLGYIVYIVRENCAFIEDIVAADADSSLERVIGHFILRMRESQVATVSISFFGGQEYLDIFARSRFTERAQERTFVLLTKDEHPVLTTASNQDNWYFLHADNDVDT